MKVVRLVGRRSLGVTWLRSWLGCGVIARGKVEVSDKQGFAEELEEEDDEAENKPPAEGGGALPRQQSLSRGVGEYFGELSLLKNVPRTATVTAIGSGVSCYVLNRTR